MQSTTPATTPGRDTMRAIVQARYGTDPDAVLAVAEVQKPRLGAGEVLVRVAAASVDMGTWHCMTGLPYAMRLFGFGVRAPKATNPGRCLAGTIVAVGEGVGEPAVGDEVYGTCDGSFAEYARVDTRKIAPKPGNLSFEQAAAAPISAVTALQAVRKAGVTATDHVLVLGASGGVGTFAVQMVKATGAEVTAVCSTTKLDLVRGLGAAHVLDYTRDDATDGRQRYDVILDIAGNRPLSHLRRALTREGRLVLVGGETGGRWLGGFDRPLRAVLLSPLVGQTLGMLASTENAADLGAVTDLIESDQVTPVIDRSYPLGEVASAIRRVRDGQARGKVVISLGGT